VQSEIQVFVGATLVANFSRCSRLKSLLQAIEFLRALCASARKQYRSLDETKRNPGIQCIINNPGFTEYIHVFCPSGLHPQFKFNPIEFSHFAASGLLNHETDMIIKIAFLLPLGEDQTSNKI